MNDGIAPTSSDLRLRILTPSWGAEVLDVDVSRDAVQAGFPAIYDAFLRYQLLLFRNQDLSAADQIGFGRMFGEVQVHVMNQYHHEEFPEIFHLSNLDGEGKPNGQHPDRGTMAWHTDGSWQKRTGQATMLYCVEAPSSGGETHFADMYGAYKALDETMKERISSSRAVHNLAFSRRRRHGEDPLTREQMGEVPPVDHPIVRTHPETKKKCLFLGDHAETIVGMEYEEGRALVEELNRQAIRPDSVYRHRWRPCDLVVWDNRCLLHRATEYDTAQERRVVRRATVNGEIPE